MDRNAQLARLHGFLEVAELALDHAVQLARETVGRGVTGDLATIQSRLAEIRDDMELPD